MARGAPSIELSDEEHAELRTIASAGASPSTLRARIVLAASTGATNKAIAEQLGTSAPTVGLWRDRFAREGVAGLLDAPRPGRPADGRSVRRVLETAAQPPPDGAGHWTVRRLARATGLPPSTVHRIWRGRPRHRGLAQVAGLDLSVTRRVCMVLGLLVDPPAAMLVLDVAAPGSPVDEAAVPLSPVDGEHPTAVGDFLRRCEQSAAGNLLVVVTETGPVTATARRWAQRSGGARLHAVAPDAWPAVAETWLTACRPPGVRRAAVDVADAARRAAGAGAAAWVVEPGDKYPPAGVDT